MPHPPDGEGEDGGNVKISDCERIGGKKTEVSDRRGLLR